MKSLYNRRGIRRAEGTRSQFAFFLTGVIVVLAVVFVIGIQVGRVIEQHAASREIASGKAGGAIVTGKETAGEIGPFSGSAGKEELPPAPSPEERVRATERSVTFRETLEKKEIVEPKLAVAAPRKSSPVPSPPPPATAGSRLYVQAAAFRNREGAEDLRKRLEAAGYSTIIAPSMSQASGVIHRVLVGPFAGKDEAQPALKKVAAEFRTRPFLVRH